MARPAIESLSPASDASIPHDVAGRFSGGMMVVKVLLFAGLAGWTTSAIFVAVFEPHYFTLEDQTFITSAAITSNYEVQSAQMAERMAEGDSAQRDAGDVVIEQTHFADAMKVAMARHDPTFKWPTGVDRTHQLLLNRLRKSKTDFGAEYDRQMISSHLLTQVSTREYLSRKHTNRGVRDVVAKSVPGVETRLRSAMSLAAGRLASGR